MEDFTALKRRVHDLIKAGALTFNDDDVFDVNRNPLPDHQRSKINAIGCNPKLQIEKDDRAVHMPMGTVYEALFKAEMLDEKQERPKFKPIPMTYTKLYPKLVQLESLVPMDIPPM